MVLQRCAVAFKIIPRLCELRHLVQDHRVQMIGPVRQEILSGIRHESQFNKLKAHLENFPDRKYAYVSWGFRPFG